MGRITETHVGVAIITMVMVNIGGETNRPLTLMHRCGNSQVNLAFDLGQIARKMKLLAMTFIYHTKRNIKNVEKYIWWNMVKYAN